MPFKGDIKDAAFWRKMARPGALVKLKDLQAYEDAMNAGDGLYLEDRIVERVETVKHQDLDASWIFMHLPGKQALVLMVRCVGEVSDAYVLYKPFDEDGANLYPDGNRENLLDADCFFLFCEPDDPEDYVPADLPWTAELNLEVPKSDDFIDATYVQETAGTQYGELDCNPADDDIDEALCSVVEFATGEDVDDKHVVILEIGIDWDPEEGEGKGEGGLVQLFFGNHITPADVEIEVR